MVNSILRIALIGASGRMGKNLLSLLGEDTQVNVIAAISSADNVGKSVNKLLQTHYDKFVDLYLTDELTQVSKSDVVIDFSNSSLTSQIIAQCVKDKVALVLGTTGLSAAVEQQLQQASNEIAICYAANYSVGVNLLLNLVAQAAQVLQQKSEIEIIEAHHKHKLDAPSGTALALAKSIIQRLGWNQANLVFDRTAKHKSRGEQEIGFAIIRAGEIVGEHQVLFANGLETLKFEHIAHDRKVFAQGAIDASKWLVQQSAGLYSMQDVLGLT